MKCDAGDETRRGGAPDLPETVRTGELLRAALAGDPAAEARLFEGLRSELLGAARRHRLIGLLPPSCSVDDVVQEVWLRCCASAALAGFRDRGPGSLGRFLATLLDRTLVDMIRRARSLKRGGRAQVLSTSDEERAGPLHRTPAPDPTPSSHARAAELLHLCDRVLVGREREVFRLVELEGLESSVVGERLGMTGSAARGVLRRARKKLIRALHEGPPTEDR